MRPADGDERRDPKREIQTDLERGQERDRSLRVINWPARLIGDHARVERTEQVDEQNAHDDADQRMWQRSCAAVAPQRGEEHDHRAEEQLIEGVYEE